MFYINRQIHIIFTAVMKEIRIYIKLKILENRFITSSKLEIEISRQ